MSLHNRSGISTTSNALLRSVSRSFYLSIRILPGRLRKPVGLGYLLARTTDTVADTAQVARPLRIETLQQLSGAIEDGAAPKAIVDLAHSFAPLQQNPAERALVEALPENLKRFDELNPHDRSDIRDLLTNITRGQMLDLQRFDSSELRALDTAAELDEYTYLVAGCVGEFWTRLCFRHVCNFSRRGATDMLALGKHYGMGLQLINVLRDAGTDLRAGRCYFPQEQLRATAMTPADILREPQRFQSIYEHWIEKAETGIAAGMQYSWAIRNRRVRAATTLPALIGRRTLALLREAGATALQRTIKVPRPNVRKMILQAFFSPLRENSFAVSR
jgi:farnesyl-diphosphate farnesyltransferase